MILEVGRHRCNICQSLEDITRQVLKPVFWVLLSIKMIQPGNNNNKFKNAELSARVSISNDLFLSLAGK